MPPSYAIPYGPAPHWVFPCFEAGIFLGFVACLVHAWKSKRRAASLAYLLGGLAFGLALEYMEVVSHSYTYGRFTWMLGRAPLDVPVCIGAAWAIIMYTSRLYSDALRFPWIAAAAVDTLLALNLDLTLDVVAYRLHMWNWDWTGTPLNPLTAQWFGIPYGNFVGWATVIFGYSVFSRWFESKLTREGKHSLARVGAVALLAVLASQAVLFCNETFLYPFMSRYLHLTSGRRLSLIIAALLLATLVGYRQRRHPARAIPAIARVVPAGFHLYFGFCFFALGFAHENRAMTAVAVANIALGLLLHMIPARPLSEDEEEFAPILKRSI